VLSRTAAATASQAPAILLDTSAATAIPAAAAPPVNLPNAREVSSLDVEAAQAKVWLPLVVMLWLAGVAALLLRLLGGWRRISRLHRVSRAAAPSAWADTAALIGARLGVSRFIHVVDTTLVDTPTVIGWMRPVILLPVAALSGLSPAQIEAILAHELAHIRRHDFLVNLLQTLAETFLFYHPAVWWVSKHIRLEREHCCDVVALSVGGDAVSYAEALVELESWRTAQSRLAVAATGGSLMMRVRRLLNAPTEERPRPFGPVALAGVVVLVICLAGASRYLLAAPPDAAPPARAGDAGDPAAWSMVFNHNDWTMRFIGYRGRDLIRFAYQIPEARVIGGPRWLDEQTLQIAVKLDAAPSADQMPAIVRQALEDRLHLKTHTEKRNFPALALVMARGDRTLGPRLRVSTRQCFDVDEWIAAGQPPREPSEWRRVPACGRESDSMTGTAYTAITMPQFAEELRAYVRGWHIPPRETPPEIASR
jgi:uncharacterized protein (TIGR03435 family)